MCNGVDKNATLVSMTTDSSSDVPTIAAGQRVPSHGLVTLTQVVAYNFRRGREARGLSQVELGARLEELTGTPWSRSTLSAAEKGWDGETGRVREFDVNELLALSLALDLPVAWFLMPPPTNPEGGEATLHDPSWIAPAKPKQTADDGTRHAVTSGEMLQYLLPRFRDARPDQVSGDRLLRDRLLDEWPAAAKYFADSDRGSAVIERTLEALSMAQVQLIGLREELAEGPAPDPVVLTPELLTNPEEWADAEADR